MERLANFIGGKFVAPQESKYMAKVSPLNAEPLYEMPDSSEVDVVLAVRAAHKAYKDWSDLAGADRTAALLAVADRLADVREELALADAHDTGRARVTSQHAVDEALAEFRNVLQLDPIAISENRISQSVGVAGIITPYGESLSSALAQIAPALFCGNTVVLKPSEGQSHSAYILAKVFEACQFPGGVVNVVFGQGEPAGSYLVRHPGVPLISFTGASATGEKVRALAAPYNKKLNLNLGAKNAALVMKDADVPLAVRAIARGAFVSPGGESLRLSKILVQEDLFKDFAAELVKEVSSFAAHSIPPLRAPAEWAQLEAWISTVRRENGRILCGGVGGQPTLVGDLTNCSEVHQTEIAGPLVTINPFKYPHEAVKWANNSPFGRCASLWTQNLSLAHKLAVDLEVGVVVINGELDVATVGWGGFKASGTQRFDRAAALEFYAQHKEIVVYSSPPNA